MMLKRVAMLASLGILGSLLLVLEPSSARAGGVVSTNCVFGFGSAACVRIWRKGVSNPHVIDVAGASSHDEKVESAERERLWVARCQPEVQQDNYGVSRYKYKEPGCEFGKFK
jgi:hypothetical protein